LPARQQTRLRSKPGLRSRNLEERPSPGRESPGPPFAAGNRA
jgi:hypothetical protein